MKLEAVSGTGKGSNKISAFDNALRRCGLENYNLIGLSSVVPPNSKVIKIDKFSQPETIGNRLYLVKSENFSRNRKECSAGIGWLYGKKGGIMVEHTGRTEAEVEQKIKSSLEEMKDYREIKPEQRNQEIVTAEPSDRTKCAFVGVVFREESWGSDQS